ncbi:DUF4350 domain-containing protein [Mucilaginibacter arboris]|uniref:DUF4350 domain-containing protein n=1 Tax=Mucilaginibacter arboris TaxID=2682090 RepID=A0A7K1SV44_9SPHI|nr:DUF4350 domain-containing protein [Mucilaginibacter arboris]MVN21201.1 DUF4350 domain-containing protein [Mucilaginibacter arboris]
MKDLKIYLIIAFSLLLVYCVVQYNRPKPVDWEPTYLNTDKIPYGTFILYHQLNDIFPGATIRSSRQPVYNTLYDALAEHRYRPGTYLIVAPKVDIDQYDYEQMINYIKKGNAVFIASFYVSQFLSDTLKLKINSEPSFSFKKKTKTGFTNPALKPKQIYAFDRQIGNQYFSKFDTSKAVVLGKNQYNHSNFIRYQFGKGFLYLMPSPDYFINYNLLKPAGSDYAAKALSYLPAKGEIIWDEYASAGAANADDSPMRVFLSHAELRRAYFMALFSLLFFVLYGIKRRQRIIPVADPLQNATVDFVKVVGQVYYQQRNNLNIASKKVTFFLEHIRSRYQLKTNVLDQELMETLISKSGANAETVAQIFKYIDYVQTGKQISDRELINLNYLTEQFYKQAGL